MSEMVAGIGNTGAMDRAGAGGTRMQTVMEDMAVGMKGEEGMKVGATNGALDAVVEALGEALGEAGLEGVDTTIIDTRSNSSSRHRRSRRKPHLLV